MVLSQSLGYLWFHLNHLRFWIAEIQKLPKEQWETWQKQLSTSFSLRPSFSIVLCANQRAESMKYAHDLVVNHFGCHIWDVRKLSIPSLKSTYFPLSIVYCFYSIYFIIGVIMKFPLQQHLLLSSSCRGVAMWTSRTEAIVMLPGGDCN